MSLDSFSELEIEGVKGELRVRSARSDERLHAPPVLHVTFEPFQNDMVRATLDPETLIGAKASLRLAADGAEVTLTGVVDQVRMHETGATATIAHPLLGLARARDHRVFLKEDAVAIAKKVCAAHEIGVTERVGDKPPPRVQTVQSTETDIAFASRLLAEEGIVLFADLTSGATTFAEGTSAYDPIAGAETLPYARSGQLAPECVRDARLTRRLAPTRVALRDFHFEKPDLDLTAETGSGALAHTAFGGSGVAHGAAGIGAVRYTDPGRGKAVAEKRLDMLRRAALRLAGTTTSPRVALGRTFKLEGAPRDDMNKTWLVVELRRELTERGDAQADRAASGDQPERYRAHFVAVPADQPYRPEVPEAPSLGGVQTATITGGSGSEISTDPHGRVTAHLRYDHAGKTDDTSSTALRVLHPPTSGGFLLPRVGWEALVAPLGVSADEPYVLGRLDNGAAPPAESLPGKRVCSNFGTPTTPGGGSGNMIRMTDTAGSEEMAVVASSNYDEQTAANKLTSVKGSDVRIVSGDRDLSVAANRGLKVDGTQTVTVGANRRQTAAAGIVIQSASELVTVGGTRDFTVGGDQSSLVHGTMTRLVGGAKVVIPIAGNNRHVKGSSTVLVGGAWGETGVTSAVTVAGLSNLASSATSIECARYAIQSTLLGEAVGSRLEKGGTISLEAGAGISLDFGATTLDAPTVEVKAASITIKAGGGTLSVKPGSVTFKGAFKAGGHIQGPGNASHG